MYFVLAVLFIQARTPTPAIFLGVTLLSIQSLVLFPVTMGSLCVGSQCDTHHRLLNVWRTNNSDKEWNLARPHSEFTTLQLGYTQGGKAKEASVCFLYHSTCSFEATGLSGLVQGSLESYRIFHLLRNIFPDLVKHLHFICVLAVVYAGYECGMCNICYVGTCN